MNVKFYDNLQRVPHKRNLSSSYICLMIAAAVYGGEYWHLRR